MKKLFTAIAMLAIVALISLPVIAAPGSLYDQEGTGDDGPAGIDASGQALGANPSSTNWKWQTGGGTWSAIYGGSSGWLEESSTGDMSLKVEADIELFMSQEVSNNEIYFHIGNLYSATLADKTAYVDGTMTYNNGMWLGISFAELGGDPIKVEADFEKDGGDNYTGVILGGMQSDTDSWREQDNQMDLEIKLNWGAGWTPPDSFGSGSHGTIVHTLWWLVDGGNPGTYNYQWRVRLLPAPDQADGDYYLDPQIVATPVL